MRKLFLLIAIVFSISAWSQKEYSISNKFPQGWAPLSDGELDIHTNFTNNATNPTDTTFYVEYIDATVPSSWFLGLCTNDQCYSLTQGTPFNMIFYTGKGKTTDLKNTQSFGSPLTAGTGFVRFLVYRAGMKSSGDTITFNGNAPATGIKSASKNIDAYISPNPVKNDLILTLNDLNITSLSIVNIVGKEVMQLDVKNGKTFDVSALPNGIYFLSIKKGEATLNKKFIISR